LNKWFYWSVKFSISTVSLKDFLKLIQWNLSFSIQIKSMKRYKKVPFQLNVY